MGKETTKAKHIEPNNRVETPSSCYSRVQTTTLGRTSCKIERTDASILQCTKDSDSDSSYYDAEEEIQRNESETICVRNTQIVNIDCLTPENIRIEQDRQPEI